MKSSFQDTCSLNSENIVWILFLNTYGERNEAIKHTNNNYIIHIIFIKFQMQKTKQRFKLIKENEQNTDARSSELK